MRGFWNLRQSLSRADSAAASTQSLSSALARSSRKAKNGHFLPHKGWNAAPLSGCLPAQPPRQLPSPPRSPCWGSPHSPAPGGESLWRRRLLPAPLLDCCWEDEAPPASPTRLLFRHLLLTKAGSTGLRREQEKFSGQRKGLPVQTRRVQPERALHHWTGDSLREARRATRG